MVARPEEYAGITLFSQLQLVALYGSLLAAMLMLPGCGGPEMPVPPARESTNPAEDDLTWIIERMEHALRMFQPPSNMGLSIKRDIAYKVIPPSDKQPDYTAIVTVTTKTIYNHGMVASTREREQSKKNATKGDIKLDDPYQLPNEEGLDDLGIDVPSVEQPTREVPAPVIPAQRAVEKREFLLKYVNDQWELQTKDLEESEKMWFDYALQTGEFGPNQP